MSIATSGQINCSILTHILSTLLDAWIIIVFTQFHGNSSFCSTHHVFLGPAWEAVVTVGQTNTTWLGGGTGWAAGGLVTLLVL